MKISGEQLAKIVEEETANVLKENLLSKTLGSVTDLYTRLNVGDKKDPELSLGTDKEKQQTPPEEKKRKVLPPLESYGTELQKQIKILMAQTNPIFLMEIKLLLNKLAPQKFLSKIVQRAKINPSKDQFDPSYFENFEKDLENFIDKLEQYSSIALKESTKKDIERKRKQDIERKRKQDINRKRKLIANIDKVMSNVRNQIFLKLSQDAEKNIDSIREDIIKYISENREKIGENNKQIVQMLLSFSTPRGSKLLSQNKQRINKWLLDNLKQDIMAVSNSLVLITKQTILNAYSQKEIPE